MIGMDAFTGEALDDMAHLRQSIRDILSTPIGSRVMRRDYGSKIYRLIDAPMNRSRLLAIYAATADAIHKWEPRLRLSKMRIVSAAPGAIELDLTGEYLPDGRIITLDGVRI